MSSQVTAEVQSFVVNVPVLTPIALKNNAGEGGVSDEMDGRQL